MSRVVDIAIEFLQSIGNEQKTSTTSFEDPVNTCVVFGYLSRITPLISDLSVTIGACSFGIEYGFCLLSRLRHLEVLVLWLLCAHVKSPNRPLDLAWMTVGGLSAERESEDNRQVAAHSASAKSADNQCHGSEDMSMVGSLEDVNLALEEIEAQDQVATVNKRWPGLRGISVRYQSRGSLETTKVFAGFAGVDKDSNVCRNETPY